MSSAPFDKSIASPAVLDADLEALAAAFGTPLFIYDEDEMRDRCREYVDAFGAENVAFAGKSFLCTAMVRLVMEEGCLLYTSPSPRDRTRSRMPSSA